MKYLFRKCRDSLFLKHIDDKKLDIHRISLSTKELSYFNLSTNSVISFFYEGKLLYFKECPKLRNRHMYFGKATERFFDMLNSQEICPEHFKQRAPISIHFDLTEIEMFRKYLKRLQEKYSFKKITNTDKISQRLGFSIWNENRQMYTAEFFCAFGLVELPQECYDIALYFIWYMRGISASYRTMRIVRSKTHSYFLAAKSISSKIVADAIGLQHMIPNTWMCRIELENGEVLLGVCSSAAEGNRMMDAKVSVDGYLQRELLNLNVLDVICFQTDHAANNYNVYCENGEYRVCAFDNDNTNTFLPLPYIGCSFVGCSPIVKKGRRYNRPFIDRDMYSNIQNVDIPLLKKRLRPYLNTIQINSLIFRIKSVRKMLKESVATNPRVLIANSDWNVDTVAEELSGKYGKTYLTIALNMRGE